MTKGRQEKLWSWTSPETGVTLQVRKVSTLLRAEVRRQVIASPGFEEPQPPMSKVDYGEGEILIPHRGHPVYQELLRDWGNRVNRKNAKTKYTLERVGVEAFKAAEAPLEIDNRSLTMTELIDSLSAPKSTTGPKRADVADRLRGKEERIIPIRRAG